MILYGRYVSPFVRRVAVWLSLQQRSYEHVSLAVTGDDYAALRAVTPIGRVPALRLDDGAVLTETWAIVDWLEETAPEGLRLLPNAGLARRDALQHVAVAHGLAEKAVALVYETIRRPEPLHYADWVARIRGQIGAALDELEQRADAFDLDAAPGVCAAVVTSVDFVSFMHPDIGARSRPRLAALSNAANADPRYAASRPG